MIGMELLPTGTSKGPARYVDPKNPFNTWSGNKRRPKWLKERLAEGVQLEDMLIPGAPKPIPAPIKYRDKDVPDNTWSGRGRRPKWLHERLKEGRLLTDFLINDE